jgi:hypothetical protein
MFTTIDRVMSEEEIREHMQSRGLTVSSVYRSKDGSLYGLSIERCRHGVHAYPKCSIYTRPQLGQTEIED